MNILNLAFVRAMQSVIGVTGDWFLAIFLVAGVLKVLLLPLAIKQQKSLLLSQNLNQARTILAGKFGNKADKINAAMAGIIARYRINPLATFAVLIVQAPVFFAFYSSVLHMTATVGTVVIPWVVNISRPDALHIVPVFAAMLQGTGAVIDKNVPAFLLATVIGLVILWKAPVGLGVYWAVNAVLGLVEKKIFATAFVRERFLNVPSVEEMISAV